MKRLRRYVLGAALMLGLGLGVPFMARAQVSCDFEIYLTNIYMPFTQTCIGVMVTTVIECSDGSGSVTNEWGIGQPCIE